jgi:nucleoside-diphosphate-sugar epimerase
VRLHLFCFGLGYVAERLARVLVADGWTVGGTTRDPERQAALKAAGLEALLWAGGAPDAALSAALERATHVLDSIPPRDDPQAPDLALAALEALGRARPFTWAGYLSSTGVYGDAGGGWVDETTPVAPVNTRAGRRVAAEQAWARWHRATGTPVDILRLAGIYGPGRSILDALRAGRARRIVKPGQLFSRIHVDDIVAAVRACMASPGGLRTYNVCDDEPSPQPDVVAYGAALIGVEPPPEEDFATAAMSETMRGMYAGCRRVSAARIKRELGLEWRYPSYRSGLEAVAAESG